jgi:hypothetical protein
MGVVILLVSAMGHAQQANQGPTSNPPINTVVTHGTLHVRLNAAPTDWLLAANVAPVGAMAKVQVFEMDRGYKDERMKMIGQGFAKAVSYPVVNVLGNKVEINLGVHDTTTVYVEAPPWTTIIVTGPKDEVLYQTPLRKTLLVSRGVEFNGPPPSDFRFVLELTVMTHEARIRLQPPRARSILQAKQ